MKISLQWLHDYVDHKLKTDELVHRLTMAGLEVEEVSDAGHTKVLEMEITPNRPDCLSVLGIAREVSAICHKKLKVPKTKTYKSTREKVPVAIADCNDCGRYIATVIKDVQIKESPLWLKERIEALGMKSINNVVDITNFCLMEFGQPLHAFDYDKLKGGKILVRRGRKGEKIKTLDGQDRELNENILVIADDLRPVALAGIMGGEETGVTAHTTSILLESAHFSSGLVRRSTRALGLTSDSAYRFERGVHWSTIERCANRAVDLILEIAGGTLEARFDVVPSRPKASAKTLNISFAEIEGLLGTAVSAVKSRKILTGLGFTVKDFGKASFKLTIPDFRNDVSQPVDVIEELARIIGFDNLPMTLPNIRSSNISIDQSARNIRSLLYDRLLAQGCDEIVTYSMTNSKSLERTGLTFKDLMRIVNPLSQEQEVMRPSLLPGFLEAVLSNVNRGEKNLRFFEFGRTYLNGNERDTLGVLLTGQRMRDWRLPKKDSVDFYDLKGLIEDTLAPMVSGELSFVLHDFNGFERGQCAQCLCKGEPVGVLGRVAPASVQNWDIKTGAIYFAQIDLQELYNRKGRSARFVPMVEFPAVVRDVSLAVKQGTAYDEVLSICRSRGGEILRSVRFLEQYIGEKMQPGYKGFVFSLTYQSAGGTLKEEQVSALHEDICQALVSQLGAIRR